jgi:zinc protease
VVEQGPQRIEADGIPILWSDVPGPFVAAAVFRTGWADETLPRHGITHLVEHLALSAVRDPTLTANGVVFDLRTLFHASGQPEEVLGFLARVAEALGELPVDRLEHERKILKIEEGGRPAGVADRLLAYRYGPRTFGLGLYGELGLGVSGLEAREWGAERFTAANCAVWMSGEPPAEFGLPLARGSRHPSPSTEPAPGLSLPLYVPLGTGGVAIGVVLERSTAALVGVQIAGQRLMEKLRFEDGLSYDVNVGYSPLSLDLAHGVLAAGCLDKDAAAVRSRMLRELSALGEQGPPPDAIDLVRQARAHDRLDPASVIPLLDGGAFDELLDGEARTWEELDRELDALTPDDVTAVLSSSLETAILEGPEHLDRTPSGFTASDHRDLPPPHGHRFVTRRVLRQPRTRHRFTVGREGVMLETPAEKIVIPWTDCAAVVPSEDGTVIRVHSVDGSWFGLAVGDYKDHETLVHLFKTLTPDGLWVDYPSEPLPEVVDAARGHLGVDYKQNKDAVRALATHLGPGEELLDVTSCTHALDKGVLAVTPRGLVFVERKAREIAEWPHEHIRDVIVLSHGLSFQLCIRHDGGESLVEFGSRRSADDVKLRVLRMLHERDA